ncbi:hypothetical protein [Oceanispirochaeta sp.]|jgi:hypothetical protein|uniref:hypothetical protein n=1 Tax=Oceanispirochaeta sp. TaxID=2035350 RepID=UPI0026125B06|nr:hypothetical protein [Oceanispirochaeta sp.]MDA3956563.1 hypothetical protein [Oceanispirochaeta sp.]
MIVISIKRLIFSFCVILCLTIILLFIGLNLFSIAPLNISFDKQEVLFWGIVILLVQFFIILSAFMGHRKLIADLNKIISYKDLNHPHSMRILDQLGQLGQVLKKMLKEQNDLLELRMNRISAANKVLSLLCEEYPAPVVISDTLGTILGVSDKMRDKIGFAMKSDSKVSDFFPDMKMAEVMVSLEKNRTPWKAEGKSGYMCTPVFDKGGHLNLCVWELESGHLMPKLNSKPVTSLSRKTFQSVKGIFKRKTLKKENVENEDRH